MPTEFEFRELTSRVTLLETRAAAVEELVGTGATGGWAGWFKSKLDPVLTALTPILITAATAWLVSLHFSNSAKLDTAARAADTAAVKADEAKTEAAGTAAKVEETKVAVDRAADQTRDAAAETRTVLDGVKREVAKPRPLFPAGGKDGDKE